MPGYGPMSMDVRMTAFNSPTKGAQRLLRSLCTRTRPEHEMIVDPSIMDSIVLEE